MTKRLLYISGTRADYGLMRSVLKTLHDDPAFDLTIAVTGMHLMPEFGMTKDEIAADGFSIREVNAVCRSDDRQSMSSFVGRCTDLLTSLVQDARQDAILLLGDRGEMLAGAIVGTYLGIPVIHIHGGEITSTVDEQVRHAITKLAHLHLPATKKSARRILLMGEALSTIHVVGAPGLDAIIRGEFSNAAAIGKRYRLDLSRPVILVIQHPVTEEIEDAGQQMRETCNAVADLSLQAVIIYPNADAGGREMIKVIHE
jgi:UDP-hydrolysing UDP-N-acetyl-D-glucosamine 2-epimerase